MTEWLNIIQESEFPLDSKKAFLIQGISILLFNIEGKYFAIRNQCTHENFPLEEGEVEGNLITCPLHGAKFCIKTGAVKAPPAFEDITTYPIRIQNGMIQIYLN